MANARRISNTTGEILKIVPSTFSNLVYQIAEGRNPHVQFFFEEVKVIRGTVPHPPRTDRFEVRNSITLQFNGVPSARGQPVIAHLFRDGTIKTSAQMHEENNRRRAAEEHLIREENKFPEFQQTAARKQAETRMMARIQAARDDNLLSLMQKQIEKSNAVLEYN